MIEVAPEGCVDVDVAVEGHVEDLDLICVRYSIQTIERPGSGRFSHPSGRSHKAARVDQGGAGVWREPSMRESASLASRIARSNEVLFSMKSIQEKAPAKWIFRWISYAGYGHSGNPSRAATRSERLSRTFDIPQKIRLDTSRKYRFPGDHRWRGSRSDDGRPS